MKNFTVFGNRTMPDYYKRLDWVIPISINILLICVMIWILISLVHHGIKTKRWKRTKQNNLQKLDSGWIYTSVIISAVLCLCYYLINLAIMNVGYHGNHYLCNVVIDLAVCFYTLTHLSIWLFMWLRQSYFYTNHMLSVSYTKSVKIVSFGSFIFIFVSAVGVVAFSIVSEEHKSTPNGCTYEFNKFYLVEYLLYIAVFLVFDHFVLLGLFFYALKKSRVKSGSVRNSSERNAIKRRKSNVIRTKRSIKNVLQKTFVFAVISISIEILLSVVRLLVKVDNRTLATIYNINVLLNILFVIFSFTGFEKMLFSFCY